MTLTKKKINKIQELRDQGFTIRKIAKKLKISTDAVCKYSQPEYSFIRTTQKEIMPYLRYELPNNDNIGTEQHTQPLDYRYPYPTMIDHQRVEYPADLYQNPQGGHPKSEIDTDHGTQPEISELQRKQRKTEHLAEIKALQKDFLKKQREQKKKQEIQRLSRKIDKHMKINMDREQREKQFAKERKQELETRETDEEIKKTSNDNLQKETKIILREIPKSKKTRQLKVDDSMMISTNKKQKDQEQESQNIDISSIVAPLLEITAPPIGNWIGTKICTYLLGKNSSHKHTIKDQLVKNEIYLKRINSNNKTGYIQKPKLKKLPTSKHHDSETENQNH